MVILSSFGFPVPKSLPVKAKVEPHSLDPAEEPLIWEGLTLNKCILVASIVALLSVSFQVLQGERCPCAARMAAPQHCHLHPLPSFPSSLPAPPCPRDGVSSGKQEPPAAPIHGEFEAGWVPQEAAGVLGLGVG